MEPLTTKKRGLSLVEIMLAITIFAIFTLGTFQLSIDTVQRDATNELRNEALSYAQEGLEAARKMRDENFLSLSNGDHGLQLSAGRWTFIAAPEAIDNFYSRTVTIEDVYRDQTGAIAETGTLDPEMKKITSEVTWLFKGVFPKSIILTTYLSNWTGDDFIDTTCTEFSTGTFTDSQSVTAPSPPNDNCSITLTSVTAQGSVYSSVNLGKHSTDVVVDGSYLYTAVADAAKGFAIIDISDPATPITKSQLYTWNKGRKIYKTGTKAYLGIDAVNPAIGIINVANPVSPSVTYAWQLAGKGNQPAVSGNYLYTTAESNGNAFAVYNISGVPYATDFLNVGEAIRTVEINGNYAYIGTEEDDEGFQVISIANPNNVTQTATLDVDEEVNAIAITGITAFVGTEEVDDSLQVINISNPASPTKITSIDVGGEIQDLVIEGDFLYAAIDNQNAGLAAINIADPLNPVLVYNLDINGKGTGIDADANYIYVSSDTSNKGIVIVAIANSGVANSGTYISPVFDTGSSTTRYNFIEWDHVAVPGFTVKFQLKTADTEENLASAIWVGSDGTNATYYENARTNITLDPNASGVRYFQYQAFLESDGSNSGEVESVRINYNP